MRIAYILLPLSFASAAAASTLVVEVGGLSAPRVTTTTSPASSARAEAEAVMAQRCALCHGGSGRADGIMSATLKPRPRDLSDVAWQRSVSDEQIAKAILEGGAAVGKSPIMPAHPDLKAKPEVVTELVRLLRGFAKRGVVRASVVDEQGATLASVSAAPDASGQRAPLTFAEVPAGSLVVRGFFDADEDGKQGANERAFEQRVVVEAKAKEARVVVELAAPRR